VFRTFRMDFRDRRAAACGPGRLWQAGRSAAAHLAPHELQSAAIVSAPGRLYYARLQSARSSGEHWAEERVEQPLGLEHAPQTQAEPGEMRRQQACVV
jgi:hypothetical protein